MQVRRLFHGKLINLKIELSADIRKLCRLIQPKNSTSSIISNNDII